MAKIAATATIQVLSLSKLTVDRTFNTRDPSEYAKTHPDMLLLRSSVKAAGHLVDPLHVSHTKSGAYLLDAGFRRAAAAGYEGIKDAICYVYEREEDDAGRRDTNTYENAKVPLSWQSQAKLATMLQLRGDKPEKIANTMIVTQKHVELLLRTSTKIQDYIDAEIVPAEALSQLTLAEAKELAKFPKRDAPDAWNHFVQKGTMPDREKQESRKGRTTTPGGLGTKMAALELRASIPWVNWEAFGAAYPPKNYGDIAAIHAALFQYASHVSKPGVDTAVRVESAISVDDLVRRAAQSAVKTGNAEGKKKGPKISDPLL